jgi:deoxyribodipyrimidine photolyase
MYWGKKILEWTRSPQRAYETTLYLNNRYFLDGRDPVSYANVAWLFGLHDRPWGPPRRIFGLIRFMNAAGLERKFDMDAYVTWVNALAGEGARANPATTLSVGTIHHGSTRKRHTVDVGSSPMSLCGRAVIRPKPATSRMSGGMGSSSRSSAFAR